jgi:hypothetical protein
VNQPLAWWSNRGKIACPIFYGPAFRFCPTDSHFQFTGSVGFGFDPNLPRISGLDVFRLIHDDVGSGVGAFGQPESVVGDAVCLDDSILG